MEISGSSKVQVNFDALKRVVLSLLGSDPADLAIKLDSRANVKASFGRFIPASGNNAAEIRIYTGAISSVWEDYVRIDDVFVEDLDVLLFMSAFLLKKYLRNTAFEIKTAEFDNLSLEADFTDIYGKYSDIRNFYQAIINETPQVNIPSKAKSKPNLTEEALDTKLSEPGAVKPQTGVTEEEQVEAKVLEVPDDLDLM